MLLSALKLKLFVPAVSVFDIIFSLIVVSPLVVTFWATSYNLYDLFILPNQPILSGLISWNIGFWGQMILMFYQDSIENLLKFGNQNFINAVVTKLYALVLGHISVNFWRGVWTLVDATFTADFGVVALNVVQNIIILMILKAFGNSLVPPFIVLTEQKDGTSYRMRTFLEKTKTDGNFTFFIDCLCTMFVAHLIGFVWHDIWFLFDTNILPDDLLCSALSSLIIGYISAFVCLTIESYVGILCEKHDKKRVVIYDIFMMVCLLSAINVWRGVWTITIYFTGDSKKWNSIVNTLSWSLLVIFNCISSLAPKDIGKDAETPGRSCTKFQIEYFPKRPKETEKKPDTIETISTRL